jgi:cyanophycinase
MDTEVNSCPIPNGILLVIGGNENKNNKQEKEDQKKESARPMEILEKFISLTGKSEPVIEIVTSASSEGPEMFRDYKKAFEELGVLQVGQIHHDRRSEVLDSDLTGHVRKADGIFFCGGDQLKLTSLYGGTSFLLQLKKRYIYEQFVLAGSSAGAMAFSTPMIFAGNKEHQQLVGEVSMSTGLEFLKDVCIDTHFVDRSRFVRMAQVIAANPTAIGIGIEEDTAIIVRNGVDIEVIGTGVVTIIEGHNIRDSNIMEYGSGNAVSVQNLNVRLLSKGCLYQIQILNPPHI